MKAGKAPAELIESARLVRCTVCEDAKPRPREHPVGPKFQFEFNACVGMDVAEARDNAGNKYSILSFVDIATGFHLAEVVKVGGGMPTSERCANAMVTVGLAGPAGQNKSPVTGGYITEARHRGFWLRTAVKLSSHRWRRPRP